MKKKNNNIDNIFESSSNVMLDSKKLSRPIENSVTLITKSIKNGNKIILFGNSSLSPLSGNLNFGSPLCSRSKNRKLRNSLCLPLVKSIFRSFLLSSLRRKSKLYNFPLRSLSKKSEFCQFPTAFS